MVPHHSLNHTVGFSQKKIIMIKLSLSARPEMCLQVSRYPETPATGIQVRTTLRSVAFTAVKLLTFGTSTETTGH